MHLAHLQWYACPLELGALSVAFPGCTDVPACTPLQELVEAHEYIEVNGVRITKPFVEKPLNAEDHNVYIYYPDRYGGGHKRLFRKVGCPPAPVFSSKPTLGCDLHPASHNVSQVNNRSSEFYPGPCSVRQEGSFIYEEFAMTMGTDIKVYAVGEAYCHAEGRKSPVVDGVVLVPSGMCGGLSPLLTRCGSSSSLSLSSSSERQ